MVQLGCAVGCALDADESIDVPADLLPEAIFNGRTWSRSWYCGDAFVRFAQDIVLEFRVRTRYGQRNPSYVCSPWWAVEIWDAPSAVGEHVSILVLSTCAR